jgi:pimeloyl-ACP methyl ester carboxylesterase
MTTAPIVLVPGFWLGAWAWDEVAAALRADDHEVTALTLPGLESADAEAVAAAGSPVVLAVHSGAGVPGYAATGRIPDRIAAVVYVDSGPATGALDPETSAAEVPLPSWEEMEAGGNSLEGLSPAQLDTFRRRAVPEPGAGFRDAPVLASDDRLDVPSTIVCTSMTSAEIKSAAEKGYPWVGGLAELRDVTYVDLPTGHWPMWSRPLDIAGIIGSVAKAQAG